MSDEPIADPEAELRERALGRLKKKRDFRSHLVAYVIINAFLWALWAITSAGYPWPIWVTLAWGIGIAFNGWDVYGRSDLSEDEIRREMERLRGGSGGSAGGSSS